MKKILFVFFVFAAILSVSARDQWTLNDKAYEVDTLIFPHPVGPGVTFAKFDLPAFPLKVSVMEMDLTNPYIQMQTWLGGERSVGAETPVNAVNRFKNAGYEVVGATNGDFYRTSPSDQVGVPTSGQITRGQVMVAPTSRASFVLSEDRKPYVDRVDFAASYTHAGATTAIGKMNNPENTGANRTCLFTRAYGPSTYTCATGKLVLLAPKSELFAWKFNGTESCVVEQVIDADGKAMTIPDGKAFLWMQGSHVDKATAMQVGDEVTITFKTTLRAQPGDDIAMKEMVGGSNHIIMRNGIYEEAWDERHPRTCIGFSADSTKVFFVVIDGRSTESLGVTTKEAVGIFTAIGAANAVNLDGGGSSCMVVNDEVVNRPSDGSVRSVGNGLVLYSTAPADDAIGMLNFEPRCYNISASAQLRFAVWGYNQYGVLKTRNQPNCIFSCDPQVGSFDADGNFRAAASPISGKIYAEYNGICTEQQVNVVVAERHLRADSVVIDQNHPYTIEVLGVSGYNSDLVDPTTIHWTVTEPQVVAIDENCRLTALANGRSWVIGTAEGFVDTLLVRVENAPGVSAPLESPIDLGTWAVTQSGGKNRTVSLQDDRTIKIDFTGSSSRNPYLRLSKRVTLWGIPEALRVNLIAGELPVNKVTFSTLLTEGAQHITAIDLTDDMKQGDTYVVDLRTADWCDATNLANYPLQLVYVQLGMESPTTGTEYSVALNMELLYDAAGGNSCDVNGDGVVDVVDVNEVINCVLGKKTLATADVNGDKSVDVVDVNAVINSVLGK